MEKVDVDIEVQCPVTNRSEWFFLEGDNVGFAKACFYTYLEQEGWRFAEYDRPTGDEEASGEWISPEAVEIIKNGTGFKLVETD